MTKPKENQLYVEESISKQVFLEDILKGLSSNPKFIPSKYHYDTEGFELFKKILEQKSYLVNKKELEIIQEHLDEIVQIADAFSIFIEFGSGPCHKIRLIFDRLETKKKFILIDCCKEILKSSAKEIREIYPFVDVFPLACDFTKLRKIPFQFEERETEKIGFFLGVTMNNFTPEEATKILRNFANLLGSNSILLMSVDLIKSDEVMINAYNDEISKEFYLNLIKRMNRELKANFPIESFEHVCKYNRENGCIQTYIRCLESCEVEISGRLFQLKTNELIHTENSYKYSIEAASKIIFEAGFQIRNIWKDKEKHLALFCLRIS